MSNALAHATLNYSFSLFVAAIPLVLFSRATSIRLVLALLLLILFTQFHSTESIFLSLAGISGYIPNNTSGGNGPNATGKKFIKALNRFLKTLNSHGIVHYTESFFSLGNKVKLHNLSGFGVEEPNEYIHGHISDFMLECKVKDRFDDSGQSHYDAIILAIDYQLEERPNLMFALEVLKSNAKHVFLEMPKDE